MSINIYQKDFYSFLKEKNALYEYDKNRMKSGITLTSISSIYNFVSSSFAFEKTIEGFSYWEEISAEWRRYAIDRYPASVLHNIALRHNAAVEANVIIASELDVWYIDANNRDNGLDSYVNFTIMLKSKPLIITDSKYKATIVSAMLEDIAFGKEVRVPKYLTNVFSRWSIEHMLKICDININKGDK